MLDRVIVKEMPFFWSGHGESRSFDSILYTRYAIDHLVHFAKFARPHELNVLKLFAELSIENIMLLE
jgi:hypothetical protein